MQVNASNYNKIESSSQIITYQNLAGGINLWHHITKPTATDKQTTIRMNRDTLYSIAIIDISQNAEITLPDVGERYISLAIQNEDGYITDVYYGGGTYKINKEEIGSDYVMAFVRILLDSKDEVDMKKVNDFQKEYKIQASSNIPFVAIDFDNNSFLQIRNALLDLFSLTKNTHNMFGKAEEVDPILFLVGTAGGFGGLPEKDAVYLNETPKVKAKHLSLTLKDVPVDGFWSITVYDKDGYMFDSEYGSSNINSLMAKANEDGSYTINFVESIKGLPNSLAIEDGWNYIVRLYKPRKEILSGEWKVPKLNVIE